MCPVAPFGAIAFVFGVWDDIADVITHAKFYVNRFRGFRVLTPPIFPISIGLAGRLYNSVITTMLYCDGAVIKTTVIARVHPVHLINAD